MSAKISRLLPALLIGCTMSLLVAACGGQESERSAATSAASSHAQARNRSTVRPSATTGDSPRTRRAQHEHHRQGEGDTPRVTPRPSPKDQVTRSDEGNLVERILGRATRDRGDRDNAHARTAIDRLLANARKEGVEVVEQGGENGGVQDILQQLGGRHP